MYRAIPHLSPIGLSVIHQADEKHVNVTFQRDAPTELQELAERVESVELNLQSINKIQSNAAAGNTQNIIRLVKRVSEVLGKIRDVVIKYGNTDGWKNASNRAKYSIWEKGGVGDLVDKLEQRTRDLNDSLIIQILLVSR